ncbi:MAG: methyltransferase family protein [Bryobacteraceae bacterium]
MREKDALSPDLIFKHLGNYPSAKYLVVATDLGVFETLAQRPLTLPDLARKTGLPARSLRILCNALLSAGLLEQANSGYRNTAARQRRPWDGYSGQDVASSRRTTMDRT